MTVTSVDMNLDGKPGELQQPLFKSPFLCSTRHQPSPVALPLRVSRQLLSSNTKATAVSCAFPAPTVVCCGGAWQQIHQFCAKNDLRNQRRLSSTPLRHQQEVTQLQRQFLSWKTFFSFFSVCRANTCGSVHMSCSIDKLRRANPCRGIHLSALADYAAPVPDAEYISPAAAVSYAAPVPVVEYSSPAPAKSRASFCGRAHLSSWCGK